MRFVDRADAAFKLLPYLKKYEHQKCVIMAVPRGGVPIAYYIAKYYNFPIELLMTKKIGHPNNPEFAVGAVSLDDYMVDETQNISEEYLEEKIKTIRENLNKRYKLFMGDHTPLSLEDKVIIIVDDGIATGNTILSSIAMLRKAKPKKIVVAVPVAPASVVHKFKSKVDEFICPNLPKDFLGVGYHYMDFSEVTDEEVIRLLKKIQALK